MFLSPQTNGEITKKDRLFAKYMEDEMEKLTQLYKDKSNLSGKLLADMIEKLAKYENLGYTPKELKEKIELAWQYEKLH